MITIIGTGIVGLTIADLLLSAGKQIQIITANSGVDDSACSWWAGGMLAPYCEMESAEPLIGELAPISMLYWQNFCQQTEMCDYQQNGTLVISPNRDHNLLTHFAQKTSHWQKLDNKAISELEPTLSKHQAGLFYSSEAHIEPRLVLKALWQKVQATASVTTNTKLSHDDILQLTKQSEWLFDCRGYQAHKQLNKLRGVRGEMLHLYNPEIELARPIRLLHPRIPIYLVPRANGELMLGATMIESSSRERTSVRSMLELLSALYAVNPAFSQSEIVEMGVDVRPAYADNLPQINIKDNYINVNGMYRHGYLLAPALATIASEFVLAQQSHPLIRQST